MKNTPHQEISLYLQSLADLDRAHKNQRYFKTKEGEYGFGDQFLGIRMPVLRQSVKKYPKATLEDVLELLRSKFHEIRIFALLHLVFQFQKGDQNIQKKIFNLYLENTKYINNWDLVDVSAHLIVGAFLDQKDCRILETLAKSTMLWERRIAVVATLHFIRKKRYTEILHVAEILLKDSEDLIHKAVGWMLREVGNRDKQVEREFLEIHYRKMPRTMLRYAIEKFSKAERQLYLKGLI